MKFHQYATRIQDSLSAHQITVDIVDMPTSTRTAEDAARSIGCQLGQIVKSLVFSAGDEPVLVLVSGKNQLDTKRFQHVWGLALQKADADFVKEQTGYSIGGVPPLAHSRPIRTFLDKDLLNYPTVWAAAGMPFSVFEINSQKLLEITKATVIDTE